MLTQKIKNIFLYVFSVVWVLTQMSLPAMAADNRIQQDLKIISNVNNPNSSDYIQYQILADQSIWVLNCNNGHCEAVFEKPIPEQVFKNALIALKTKAPSASQLPKLSLRDFLIGAGVTHISTALAGGILMSVGAYQTAAHEFMANTPPMVEALSALAVFSTFYLISPVTASLFPIALVAGSGGALFVSLAGVTTVSIAAIGGISYMIHKKNKTNEHESLC